LSVDSETTDRSPFLHLLRNHISSFVFQMLRFLFLLPTINIPYSIWHDKKYGVYMIPHKFTLTPNGRARLHKQHIQQTSRKNNTQIRCCSLNSMVLMLMKNVLINDTQSFDPYRNRNKKPFVFSEKQNDLHAFTERTVEKKMRVNCYPNKICK
jgi:hypothetical protein